MQNLYVLDTPQAVRSPLSEKEKRKEGQEFQYKEEIRAASL
jgi:hypothetical protein